ncbi:MAG: TIGR02221 family CRISPR-associated protein [Thiolinea sp.]
MAKIFISFLGTGMGDPDSVTPGYNEVIYLFEDGTPSQMTRFAQRAIIEKHGAQSFERICLLMTEQSKKRHRQLLVDELASIGCSVETQIEEDDSITTNQNAEQQWEWFHSLQKLIKDDDEVIFDFTHGFRSVPIIFSTAISFLQKVKRFELLHAYYGYVDQKAQKNEIIDMAKFYRINEWADGVSRLVDTADASKLAALAEEGKDDGFAALNDPKLVKALRDLTDLIKNIDVNNVAKKADEALNLIQQKRKQCSGADEQLLKMVVEKFEDLAITMNSSYDVNYFKLQLLLAEMLLKHELYMQAFTVMRECVGSLVMLKSKSFSREYKNRNQAKLRYILSDIFISLFTAGLENSRHKNKNEFSSIVMPFYDELRQLPDSPIPILESFVIELTDLRNGFNHAWVSKNGVPSNLDKKGKDFLTKLNKVIETLIENRLL